MTLIWKHSSRSKSSLILWNISTPAWWISTTFGTDIHHPQTLCCNDSLWSYHEAGSSGFDPFMYTFRMDFYQLGKPCNFSSRVIILLIMREIFVSICSSPFSVTLHMIHLKLCRFVGSEYSKCISGSFAQISAKCCSLLQVFTFQWLLPAPHTLWLFLWLNAFPSLSPVRLTITSAKPILTETQKKSLF